MRSRKNDLIKILTWTLIVYILFVVYQILRALFGGSWSTESIIIALVIANLGYTFLLTNKLEKHLGMHAVWDKQFSSLCKDFKVLKDELHQRSR
ncbi:MAG: hypothetical protein ABIC95_06825 [archaeon]